MIQLQKKVIFESYAYITKTYSLQPMELLRTVDRLANILQSTIPGNTTPITELISRLDTCKADLDAPHDMFTRIKITIQMFGEHLKIVEKRSAAQYGAHVEAYVQTDNPFLNKGKPFVVIVGDFGNGSFYWKDDQPNDSLFDNNRQLLTILCDKFLSNGDAAAVKTHFNCPATDALPKHYWQR